MSYPIHITNIYELLNEDGEGVKAIPVPQKEVKAPVPSKGTSSKPNTSQNTQPSKSFGTSSSNSNSAPRDRRGGERSGPNTGAPRQQREPRSDRPPREREPRADRSADSSVNPGPSSGGEFETTRSRGDNGFRKTEHRRGGRGDAAAGINGKRLFDRHSGTGRGREFKKGGSGKGNWGKEGEGSESTAPLDEFNPEEGTPKEERKEEPEPVPKTEAELAEEKRIKDEQELEDKLMTLDDYYKKRENKALNIELPAARKANEGVDQSELKKWGNYQELKKVGDNDDDEKEEEKSSKKKEKNFVPLDQVFAVKEAPRREREDRPFRGGRGGRGSRGGSRGGRGESRGGRGESRGGNRGDHRGEHRGEHRGGNRGGNRSENAPQFDESSFPTLATK